MTWDIVPNMKTRKLDRHQVIASDIGVVLLDQMTTSGMRVLVLDRRLEFLPRADMTAG